MSPSKIEWTEPTGNPVTGGAKMSPSGPHGYAETRTRRLQALGVPGYQNGFALTVREGSPSIAARASETHGLFRRFNGRPVSRRRARRFYRPGAGGRLPNLSAY
jgi:protein gp37